MKKSLKGVLLILLLIAIAILFTGCGGTTAYSRYLRYICTLPTDNHVLVFQYTKGDISHTEGEYEFIFVDTDINSYVDTDIDDQIKNLETNIVYRSLIASTLNGTLYLCSFSQLPDDQQI